MSNGALDTHSKRDDCARKGENLRVFAVLVYILLELHPVVCSLGVNFIATLDVMFMHLLSVDKQ